MIIKRSKISRYILAGACFSLIGAGYAEQQLPKVFIMNAQGLARAKAAIATQDTNVIPSLAYLRRQADARLTAGPWSVVNNLPLPPSGDKHDYFSIGVYWWPDPGKPDGLPYIRKDGKLNPECMKGSGSDLPLISELITTVDTLALCYYFTGEEKYAERAAYVLRVWFTDPATKMNPNLIYAQGVPGLSTGRAVGIIDTGELPTIIDAIGLLSGSKSWTEADQQAMVKWVGEFLDWLRTSDAGREEGAADNNHGSYYDRQIASYALFTGQNDLAKRILESVKTKRIGKQIEPDGKQPAELSRTRSLNYSIMNVDALFDLAAMGQCAGVDLYNYTSPRGSNIRAALNFLAPYVDEKKEWLCVEPKHTNRSRLLPVLRHAAIVYNDNSYEELIQKNSTEDSIITRYIQLLYPYPKELKNPAE